jgi:hypothetical protein
MVGFLFGSALSAAVLAGWPVYLHLRRRRRMRIQSVPSLRLFGFTQRKTKQIRFQQLALLIARVAFVLAIAMLLAQPFVHVSRYLPLPPVAGEKQDNLVLAVVLDDSLSSMHGSSGKTRLDSSRALLKRVIQELPPNCNVSFTLTSSPFAGPLMKKDEALAYLEKVTSIPRPGEAVEAMRQVVQAFAGRNVCFFVSAPRADDLWYSPDKAFDSTEGLTVFLHDLDSIQTSAMIMNIEAGVIKLRGKPGDLLGKPFTSANPDGNGFTRKITAHEALIGEIAMPPTDEERYLRLTIGSDTHPWQRCFHRPGSNTQSKRHVVILRRTEGDAIAADKIVSGVLLSSGLDVTIHHLDPSQDGLPEQADAVVAIDALDALPTVSQWLSSGGGKAATLVTFPPPTSTSEWNAPVETDKSQIPTKIVNPQNLPIDELALLEVRTLRPDRLAEPRSGMAILTMADDIPIVTKEIRTNGRPTWRMGFRVTTSEAAVYHPSFPLLLSSILLPEDGDTEVSEATVGDVARVDKWFGSDQLDGSIALPNGEVLNVPRGAANATFVKINAPGEYRFATAGDTRYRIANMPRDTSMKSLSKDELRALLGNPALQTVAEKRRITAEDFQYLEASTSSHPSKRKRRDLSPIVFALALAFLSIEAVLLHIVWRRRASISE